MIFGLFMAIFLSLFLILLNVIAFTYNTAIRYGFTIVILVAICMITTFLTIQTILN